MERFYGGEHSVGSLMDYGPPGSGLFTDDLYHFGLGGLNTSPGFGQMMMPPPPPPMGMMQPWGNPNPMMSGPSSFMSPGWL